MNDDQQRRPDPNVHLVLGFLSAGVLIAAAVLQIPGKGGVNFLGWGTLPELCWFHRVTGWNCPGCGLTRSFVSLMHGQWSQAWEFNPAGPPFFLLIAGQIPYRAWQYWRMKSGREEVRWPTWQWVPLWSVFAIIFVQWLWQMLSMLLVSDIDYRG